MSKDTPPSSATGQTDHHSNNDVQPPGENANLVAEKGNGAEDQSNTRDATNVHPKSANSSGASLLEAILSPFSSFLGSTANPNQNQDSHPDPQDSSDRNGKLPIESQVLEGKATSNDYENLTATKPAANTSKEDTTQPAPTASESDTKATPPEAYYKPNEVPLFKKLQKKRLSGTRTKQLLRAASRAHDDPPPPPELGTCCGSSCDPCVNDLWREERDVWRERWGDRSVEGDSDGKRKELEW